MVDRWCNATPFFLLNLQWVSSRRGKREKRKRKNNKKKTKSQQCI